MFVSEGTAVRCVESDHSNDHVVFVRVLHLSTNAIPSRTQAGELSPHPVSHTVTLRHLAASIERMVRDEDVRLPEVIYPQSLSIL